HSDQLFAVSNDANPLDGFSLQERIHIGNGDLLDFDKMGYNADAIILESNDFKSDGTVPVQFIAIDKAQLLSGNFVDFTYQLGGFPDHFRADVPAQMHGSVSGDPIWLMSTDGYPNATGNTTIRVTKLTNELSNSPVFTETSLTVNPFGQPTPADQPGAPGSVATNDATT